MSDVNEHLIAHLRARAISGMDKYGVPLTAFNGRNPRKDKREELLDALVYNEQDILERERVAGLLEEASAIIMAAIPHVPYVSQFRMVQRAAEFNATAILLRQDIKRIEPEE